MGVYIWQVYLSISDINSLYVLSVSAYRVGGRGWGNARMLYELIYLEYSYQVYVSSSEIFSAGNGRAARMKTSVE